MSTRERVLQRVRELRAQHFHPSCLTDGDRFLLERLTTLHGYRIPYTGTPRGELFIHWFYRDRSEDRLSRCEIFHLNMLRYFNVMDRVEVIHVRCATTQGKTRAMEQAISIISEGHASVDFQLVTPKRSWEHDTFKECVEYAVSSGKFVYYIHFKGASRISDPTLGIPGRILNHCSELDLLYWNYLMYLAMFNAPDGVKAIGPLLHKGMNKTYKNRDKSWSQLCTGAQVFHYCGSFQAFSGDYIRECLAACGMADRPVRDAKLWINDPYTVEMFLSLVALQKDVYSLNVPYTATNGIYACYTNHKIPQYENGFKELLMGDIREAESGLIVVVGSRSDNFPYMAANKRQFFREGDPDNLYYNEMCGHRYLLEHMDELADRPYVGLEHYRRAFVYTDEEIKEILSSYDIIVKGEHGPYGEATNLTVLKTCSRHGLDYYPTCSRWIERFPELRGQADARTHYGCNMFITTPDRFKVMMQDEFRYITELLEERDMPQSCLSYFCETILTPYIIKKHNSRIFVGHVRMP